MREEIRVRKITRSKSHGTWNHRQCRVVDASQTTGGERNDLSLTWDSRTSLFLEMNGQGITLTWIAVQRQRSHPFPFSPCWLGTVSHKAEGMRPLDEDYCYKVAGDIARSFTLQNTDQIWAICKVSISKWNFVEIFLFLSSVSNFIWISKHLFFEENVSRFAWFLQNFGV